MSALQANFYPGVQGDYQGLQGAYGNLGDLSQAYMNQWASQQLLAQQQLATQQQLARPPVFHRSISQTELSIARRARVWRRVLRVVRWLAYL